MDHRFPKPEAGRSNRPGATNRDSFLDNAVSCGMSRAAALAWHRRLLADAAASERKPALPAAAGDRLRFFRLLAQGLTPGGARMRPMRAAARVVARGIRKAVAS